MEPANRLLLRLDAIAQSLAQHPEALALLTLGSVGRERARLDAYSDLDFFAIVTPAAKAPFIDDLAWLGAAAPIAYSFRNTADGHKALFEDGIFCEFAVFEPAELAKIPFAPGLLVWKRDEFNEELAQPRAIAGEATPPTREWLVGEIVCNLLIGLNRFHRGEHLAAAFLVQQYAVRHLLQLADLNGMASPEATRDPFAPERRAEQRFPQLAAQLDGLMPGAMQTPAAARAILALLAQLEPVPPAMRDAIESLL